MIKLSHISIFLLCVFLLTSCFGIGGNDAPAGLGQYNGEGFDINIPSSWTVLDDSSNDLPSPSAGKIALSVSSADVKGGFSNNLLILSEETDVWVDSEEFSKVTHVSSQEEYYFYDKISEKTITFTDESTSKIYIFDAKYNKSTPKLHFLQTGRICSNTSYLLTIAVSSAGDSSKYEDILKTFECK